ncbi:MAG TPA: 2-phosphosulfolactate phosphatase [Methylomirabilota bacterium]|nr:2-phosphosulfolactate phosphatase [Methylomirabilota bacterium]
MHVALTPADPGAGALDGRAALVVDVLRATSTVVAACCAGCRRVIPVGDAEAAVLAASRLPRDEVVLAGERGGEPIAGFDLGNSPLEFTPSRVGGRTIVLTTTNGTASMRSAGLARVGAAAALVNVGAAAAWALGQERDVTVLCSGDDGALSLEDTVCAGLLVQRMLARIPSLELSDAAVVALRLGEYYGVRLGELLLHSRWAGRLAGRGRSADLQACVRLDTTTMVPVFERGSIVPGPGVPASTADLAGAAGPETAR